VKSQERGKSQKDADGKGQSGSLRRIFNLEESLKQLSHVKNHSSKGQREDADEIPNWLLNLNRKTIFIVLSEKLIMITYRE
jgi:hypothetical protein